MNTRSQQTIGCASTPVRGVCLHSGLPVTLQLLPGEINSGIVIERTDLGSDGMISCSAEAVSNTLLATTVSNESGAEVSTIEHLLSALWACGIDNVRIRLDAAEMPSMDGSASPFMLLVMDAGIKEQEAPRQIWRILQPVEVSDSKRWARLEPYGGQQFEITVDFEHPVIRAGGQQISFDVAQDNYATDIASARTFGFTNQIAWLRKNQRALGGSLDNAVVLDTSRVLNPSGLRMPDEPVRHKLLDAIGDCYVNGVRLEGRYVAHQPGHCINNMLMRKLMATPAAYEVVAGPQRLAA